MKRRRESARTELRRIRCAAYTRKSTEENLDTEFNSLDAQREAAEAYIASQRQEGWVALPTRYDDGGFSGSNMERPGLQRLLEDVGAGRVDCVVVYKVVLASRCDSLLLLTATPHDGHDRSFASLLELLDPSLVDASGQIRGTRYRSNVIRRLKPHIKDPETGEPRFKERMVEPRPVEASESRHPHFVTLQRRLLELIAPELRRAFRSRRYSDVLAFIALLKRSVSTVRACRTTLGAVAERFNRLLSEQAETEEGRRQRLRSLREYQRKLQRFGALSAEEEEEQALLEAEDIAQQLVSVQREIRSGSRQLARVAGVTEALDELSEMATKAEDEDPKLTQLVEEIADIRRQVPRTNVLVYTEYGDSQRAAVEAIRAAGVGTVLTLSGGDNEPTRSQVTERFRTQDNLVLVSTDAAAENRRSDTVAHRHLTRRRSAVR